MAKLLKAAIAAAVLVAAPAQAAVTSIDFSIYAPGTSVSSIPGASVSLTNATGSAPVVGYGFFDSVLSLNNSVNWGVGTSGYPTGTAILFDFTAPVSGISFTFNNYGFGNGSFYSVYDAALNLLETNVIDSVNGFGLVSVAASGVSRLEINNGSGGSFNWIYGVGQLSFTGGVIPEPATWAMMIAGFGLVGAAMRRRQGTVAA